MIRALSVLFLVSFALIACGPDKASIPVQLIYGEQNSAVEEIFQEYAGVITARVIFSHEKLQPGSQEAYHVEPKRAAPTRLSTTNGQNVTATTFWHKASAAGFAPFARGEVVIPNIPLNQKRLRIGIEFILQYEEATTGTPQYFVVAYGCFVGPDTAIKEDELRARLKQGMLIYAGRTCGRCPIVETANAEMDAPGFTAAELADEAPEACP